MKERKDAIHNIFIVLVINSMIGQITMVNDIRIRIDGVLVRTFASISSIMEISSSIKLESSIQVFNNLLVDLSWSGAQIGTKG
jgi:hypothetical protein